MVKTIPSELMVTDVSITNYHRVYSTESMSGIETRRDSGVQWYRGTITLQAYGFDNVRRLNGFLAGLKGKLHPFALPLGGAYANPQIKRNPNLNGAAGIGVTSMKVFHTGGDICAGSVFTVPNDTKLYTLLDDLETNETSALTFTPAFKKAHVNLEEINFMAPVITALLDSNETTVVHQGNGKLSTATISWREQLT
ncbi:hypothetical protein F2P58_23465 [Vibrio fortis]|uniref:Uncharacterized protein n=1 Tax=Vibrio fortis TaxID=212667 RepID=A0A5N3QUX3_9VIBR|nr:hypothetical protein [Vibrio fortis]KAB0285472.1 hypothetical protein F2P58_23465 [Vibrio fortis]